MDLFVHLLPPDTSRPACCDRSLAQERSRGFLAHKLDALPCGSTNLQLKGAQLKLLGWATRGKRRWPTCGHHPCIRWSCAQLPCLSGAAGAGRQLSGKSSRVERWRETERRVGAQG